MITTIELIRVEKSTSSDTANLIKETFLSEKFLLIFTNSLNSNFSFT